MVLIITVIEGGITKTLCDFSTPYLTFPQGGRNMKKAFPPWGK
jgi:hypothetical protein